MVTLASLIPEPDALLSMAPEELAGAVLECLNALSQGADHMLHARNFCRSQWAAGSYPSEYQQRVSKAIMEAWVWLEREGLIAPNPYQHEDFVFITRRGEALKTRTDLASYRHADLLPRGQLHPRIAQKVFTPFMRGDYDTAIFQSYKEVEVAVREAGGYSPLELGVGLMRKAFKAGSGPLADQSSPISEQEALCHLFAGAIGYYKNPASHRRITVSDPVEAVEIISLASHLLRIVDLRNSSHSSPN